AAALANHGDVGELRRLAVALVLEELVRTEYEALGQRLRGVVARERRRNVEQRGRDRRRLRRTARDCGGGAARVVERELGDVTDADEQRGAGAQLAAGGDGERFAEVALETGFLEERLQAAVERGVDGRGAGREHVALGDRHREQVGGDAVR